MSYQPPNKNTKHLSVPFMSKPVTQRNFSANDVFKYQDNKGNIHHHYHENLTTASKSTTKPQVYMPGERVILAESPSAPGIPIIYRLEEERKTNPDKLNLDRRKLCVCPLLEGEENLRLLNLQHNSIRRIQHLNMLRKLIFLDLYDNHIEEISGLSSLKCLRVLMLGKNKIRKITNLQDMIFLDVLDLHGNKISTIENLSMLHQLRVLNLAGNDLTEVKNLDGLMSLSELNLRRNSIKSVVGLDLLPSLQRVFLSYNDIESFDDISCLANSSSLVDLALDNNPLANQSHYKQCILQSVTTLKQLDMRRLTEEEKRIAQVIARKEEEKRKENERIISIKERRRIAISNAKRQWDKQFNRERRKSITPTGCDYGNSKSTRINSAALKDHNSSSCHLAELDNDTLNLYGPRSLDAMDKNWGEKSGTSSVETISFRFINFHDIIPRLKTLNDRFPAVQTLCFEATNITALNEINALAQMRRMLHVHIADGNPVTDLRFWKEYVIFKLKPLKLTTINGQQITSSAVKASDRIFGKLRPLLLNRLPSYMNGDEALPILTHHQDNDGGDGNGFDADDPGADGYTSFSKNYIREVMQDSIAVTRRLDHFERMWPHMLQEMVTKYVGEMVDVEAYCKKSLDKIRAS